MNNILVQLLQLWSLTKPDQFIRSKRRITFKVLDENVNDFEIGDMIEGFLYQSKRRICTNDEYPFYLQRSL